MTSIPKPAKRERKPKKRPRRKRKSTPAQLAREADKLWSLIVRQHGGCEVAVGVGVKGCSGGYQAAHGFSRRYRHTRWLPLNGFCLCAGHHVYYTHRPLEWDDYIKRAWGQDVYNDLRLIALRAFKPDVGAALEVLREEAKARGIEA